MGGSWTWEQLAAATLARQFPAVVSTGADAVVELLGRVGPVQSQVARAPFVSMAARLPGTSYDDIVAAHEELRVVRSTSIRGTVHTSTREQHADLAAVARRALAPGACRLLRLDASQLRDLRAELERLTSPAWTSHDDLVGGVVGWLTRRGLAESLRSLDGPGGLYSLRGHPTLLRRPGRPDAGWESQAEVYYRCAAAAIGERLGDPQDALLALVRHQLAAAGPASRRDLAWWSGAGLRAVDAAIESLDDEISRRSGPNGLEYVDLVAHDLPAETADGPRLLPEYDALLLAYDPAARDRFADAAAIAHSWNKRNGVHACTLLLDGRLRGRWRLARSAAAVALEVEMFPGERLPDEGELTKPAAALAAALDIVVPEVRVRRIP